MCQLEAKTLGEQEGRRDHCETEDILYSNEQIPNVSACVTAVSPRTERMKYGYGSNNLLGDMET